MQCLLEMVCSLVKISVKFHFEFLGQVPDFLFQSGRSTDGQPLQSLQPFLHGLHGWYLSWSGEDSHLHALQALGIKACCCFLKLDTFIFLTHQTKRPEQNSLYLSARHPAADLSSAKQGKRACGAPEKGWEWVSTGCASPCLPAQKRRRGKERISAPAQQPF